MFQRARACSRTSERDGERKKRGEELPQPCTCEDQAQIFRDQVSDRHFSRGQFFLGKMCFLGFITDFFFRNGGLKQMARGGVGLKPSAALPTTIIANLENRGYWQIRAY